MAYQYKREPLTPDKAIGVGVNQTPNSHEKRHSPELPLGRITQLPDSSRSELDQRPSFYQLAPGIGDPRTGQPAGFDYTGRNLR